MWRVWGLLPEGQLCEICRLASYFVVAWSSLGSKQIRGLGQQEQMWEVQAASGVEAREIKERTTLIFGGEKNYEEPLEMSA